jgi:ribosomal protein L7/L12
MRGDNQQANLLYGQRRSLDAKPSHLINANEEGFVYQLIIESDYPQTNKNSAKIHLIKELRLIANLSLLDSKTLVDSKQITFLTAKQAKQMSDFIKESSLTSQISFRAEKMEGDLRAIYLERPPADLPIQLDEETPTPAAVAYLMGLLPNKPSSLSSPHNETRRAFNRLHQVPSVILRDLSEEEGKEIVTRLNQFGAKASLV